MLVPLLVHGNITGQLPAAWSVTAGVVAQLLGGRNTGRNTDGNSGGTVGELRRDHRRNNVPRPQLDTFGRIKKAAGALPRPRESIAPAPLLPLRSMPLRHRWPHPAPPPPPAPPRTGKPLGRIAPVRRTAAAAQCAAVLVMHRPCTGPAPAPQRHALPAPHRPPPLHRTPAACRAIVRR